jgi:Xaa-Pro aminopeptidase
MHLESVKALRPGIPYMQVYELSARVMVEGMKQLGLMKGNAEDAVREGAHALFYPHGLGHMMGLDVHDMENYGQINVGYDDETRPSSQFGLGSLRCGRRLQPGFVITDEPGCYFIPALIDQWHAQGTNKDYINFDELEKWKDFGGIRIEDDILVTADGCRVLGKPIPKTVAEIEQTMNS